MTEILFYSLAIASVMSALSTIWQQNPIASAISLIVTLLCQAGLYVLLQAHFVATLQVLLYAGAIFGLFTFVILFLNLQDHKRGKPKYRSWKFAGGGLALVAGAFIIASTVNAKSATLSTVDSSFGNSQSVASDLLTHYLFLFEVLALVLTVALTGTAILGKKDS